MQPRPLCILLFLLAALTLRAHETFESSATFRLQHGAMEVTLIMSTATVSTWLDDPEADISAKSIDSYRPRLIAQAPGLFQVLSGGSALPLTRSTVAMGQGSEVQFFLVYPAPPSPRLSIHALYLSRLPGSFHGAIQVLDENESPRGSKILTRSDAILDIDPDAQPPAPAAIAGAPSQPAQPIAPPAAPAPAPGFRDFLQLGIEHILTGYDHLLFLCGLLVACRRVRSILAIITAFTIAHSITLALAAFNIVSLSSRIVEPFIAATIVFVAVENLILGEGARGRAWIAGAFGLIHGFGFAGALRETGLATAGAAMAIPLFSFNLGVEIGQLSVAAIFVPILLLLKKSPLFDRYGINVISILIAIAGSFWFIQRVFL